MSGYERVHGCKSAGSGRGALPFVLSGAKAVYAPDRVCDVRHIKVEVDLDFATGSVDGTCTQTLCPLNDGPARLVLHAAEMIISAVTLPDGSALPFTYESPELRVDLGPRRQGELLDLVIRYRCTPRRGLYFIAPDEHDPGRPVQVWSQGQDEDNRHWIPCFDHPHEKATSEMVATVPERFFVLSNGRLLATRQGPAAGTRTYHYRHDVPHSSYLITLVAGEYVELRDRAGEVDLYYYVPQGREEDAWRSFSRTPEMVRLFATRTGVPYPYERYSQIVVSDFIFGGMENTSATTLTDHTLHDARAHLDFSSEPLVSHELAHQWFGDLVTCRDWSHGWLNEGFATYLEIVWREHSEGRSEADYDRLVDMKAYLDEDHGRYRRPVVTNIFHEPIDLFDRHLYEKGSAVVHMLRVQLGEARFWKGIQHYLDKHRGGLVETRDLSRALEEATGANLDRFFDQWIFKAGYPELKVDYAWDEDQKLARLTVRQVQKTGVLDDTPGYQTPLFELFLTVRFVVNDTTLDRAVRVHNERETFAFPLPSRPAQVIFDTGSHLLKTLEMKKPDELWRNELSSAELAVDWLLAARALGKGTDPRSTPALYRALREDPFWAVRGAAAKALGQVRTDAAREALAAAVKAETHPRARRQIVQALAAFRHDPGAQDVLGEVLAGDPSYFVEAEAALALAKARAPEAFAALTAAMRRPSFLDVIAASCLSGLVELHDERSVEVALRAGQRARPLPGAAPVPEGQEVRLIQGRRAAVAALGRMGEEFASRRRQILEALGEHVEDPDFRLRISAVDAIREMGDLRGRPALRRASERDLDGRVRRHAREALKALSEGAARDEQATALRETVEKLEDENLGLKERLARIEARLGIAEPQRQDRPVLLTPEAAEPAPAGAVEHATVLSESNANPTTEVRHEGKES